MKLAKLAKLAKSCAPHSLKKIKFFSALSVAIAVAAVLTGCGGGGGDSGPGTSGALPVNAGNTTVTASNTLVNAPTTSNLSWVRQEAMLGACCNYTSLVFGDDGEVRIYSNTSSQGANGSLNVYRGSLQGVGESHTALVISSPSDAYIRTSGITRYAGRYFALLYTGDKYPATQGFAPSWADSDDGLTFTWRGPALTPYRRGYSSGEALTVDSRGVFRAWIDEVGGTLKEMSSSDGIHWADEGEMWPTSLPAGQAVFPSAARSTHGVMLSVADAFPSKKIRVLWKCDTQSKWAVLEEQSAIHQGEKGTSLAWDGKKFHAYGNGQHWTRDEPSCG